MTTSAMTPRAKTTPVKTTPVIALRDPQPGDMGWVVQQHAEVYWREYGWDIRFEALVAGIVSRYVQKYQPDFEHCWIGQTLACWQRGPSTSNAGSNLLRHSPTKALARTWLARLGSLGFSHCCHVYSVFAPASNHCLICVRSSSVMPVELFIGIIFSTATCW